MNSRLETVLSVVVAVSALAVASVFVYRQVAGSAARPARTAAPRLVADWESMLADAQWIGNPSAKVRIVEFSDFQCPFCRRFHETFAQVQTDLGADVALAYIHFPLASHEHAEPAAVLADCAAAQGLFPEVVNELFAKQDSLGTKPWRSFADGLTIPSEAEFEMCLERDPLPGYFDRLRAIGSRVPVLGTPTVIVNGWLLPAPPGADSLLRISRDLIAGKKAF